MNPTEAAFVSSYARGVIGDVVLMAVTTLFYGFYVLIFSFAAIVLCRRKRSTATLVMFALTTVVFLFTTADWIASLYNLVDLIQVGFVDLPGSDLVRQFQKAQARMQWIFVFDEWPMNVNMSVNDAILVWRVCCLFPHNVWVRVSVCFLGIASGALALALAIGASVYRLTGGEEDTLSGTERLGALPTAWIAVSIFTNMVCIGLISRIAWKHRTTLLRSKSTSSIQKILSFLVESGVIFVILQLTMFITQCIERPLLSPQDITATSIVRAATLSAAIVPSLVLVVVSQEGSLSHGDGKPGPLDDEISTWKIAKDTSASLDEVSKWNAETFVIQADMMSPHWRFAPSYEV
ncbi:hypothetical protein DL96DRAFT_808377 [Flagelloscypha sp. PMI_526]|nr:hypothetical protein DL96DRAFT_808377 [Flagelloscypha sp. PMI_526]